MGEPKKVAKEMTTSWEKTILFYQQHCPDTNYMTSTKQMSLTYFVKLCHLKFWILKDNIAQVENITKRESLEWLYITPFERKSQCLWWISLPNQDASTCTKSPCRYQAPQKAWMDEIIFEEWLRRLDCKFQKQGQKYYHDSR